MKNTSKRLAGSILAIVVLLGCLAGCSKQTPVETVSDTKATIVLKNGVVHTMDASGTEATAVAIKDNTIVYVGDDSGVEKFVGTDTEVIDLEGKMVSPGFVDGHIHAGYEAAIKLYQVYFSELEPNKEVYLKAVEDFIKANPDINLVSGFGWQVGAFGDEGPTKEMLDAISTDVPMVLRDISGHIKWCNSLALEKANIDETTDQGSGEIRKDENGNVTGMLVDFTTDELTAMEASLKLNDEQTKQALLEFQKQCNEYGITAVNTDSTGMIPRADTMWRIISELEKAGELTLRFNEKLRVSPDDDTQEMIALVKQGQEQYASDFLNISQVKLFLDGVVEGGTGLLLAPYAPEAGLAADFKGESRWDVDAFNEAVAAYDAAGLQIHVHAIADGSTRMVVDAVENAHKINGTSGGRHTIAHMTIFSKDDIQRIVDNGIICAVQPIWSYRDPVFSQLEEKMLGSERFATMYMLGDLVAAGAIMTGSADNPATADFSPLSGIETGATQCSPYAGQDTDPQYIRNADQAVPVADMLKAYTYNGAYGMCMDDIIGSIEVGKKADIVVLGSDILTIPKKDISETKVVYTIMNGKVVYENQ